MIDLKLRMRLKIRIFHWITIWLSKISLTSTTNYVVTTFYSCKNFYSKSFAIPRWRHVIKMSGGRLRPYQSQCKTTQCARPDELVNLVISLNALNWDQSWHTDWNVDWSLCRHDNGVVFMVIKCCDKLIDEIFSDWCETIRE